MKRGKQMRRFGYALASGLFTPGALAAQNGDADRARCAGNNPVLAISSCTAVIQAGKETNESLAVAFHYRGNAWLERGDSDHAIADFAQAIRLNSGLSQNFYDRGRAYLAKKDYGHALDDFNQAIRLNPDIPAVYDSRGVAYYQQGDANRAAQDYERAIILDSNYAPALVHRGNLYADKGDYDRGIMDYDDAVRRDPRNAEAWHRRGAAYFRKQDYASAEDNLDGALVLDPDNWNAVWRRAVTRFALGHFAEAAQDAERSVKLTPDWLYGTLWEYIANARSNPAKPANMLPYSGKVDASKWPGPIFAMYAGVLTAGQVSDAAVKAGAGKNGAGYLCEAAFYIGELRLIRNNFKGARESLESAVKTCPHSFDEYYAAVAELARLQ